MSSAHGHSKTQPAPSHNRWFGSRHDPRLPPAATGNLGCWLPKLACEQGKTGPGWSRAIWPTSLGRAQLRGNGISGADDLARMVTLQEAPRKRGTVSNSAVEGRVNLTISVNASRQASTTNTHEYAGISSDSPQCGTRNRGPKSVKFETRELRRCPIRTWDLKFVWDF